MTIRIHFFWLGRLFNEEQEQEQEWPYLYLYL